MMSLPVKALSRCEMLLILILDVLSMKPRQACSWLEAIKRFSCLNEHEINPTHKC